MKIKITRALAAFAVLMFAGPAFASDYDPINTMSAVNMAIVSIHRIASSRDRVVLDAEYRNIIDNLSMGNIEADPEIKELYTELMAVIGSKTLREDESARVDARYRARDKSNLADRLPDARLLLGNPWGFIGSLFAGETALYFGAQMLFPPNRNDAADDELWRLERENIEEMASLQRRLLDSSWTLLRKYSLPDEYLLSSQDLDALNMAVSEGDAERGLRMFKALEPDFKMYAPFWYYYSAAASRAGDMTQAAECLNEFERVWRPVLRRDPFRAEVAKLRAAELSQAGAPKEAIAAQLEIVMGNSMRENWVNNLFAGATFYSIGETDRAIQCVSINTDFGVESEISGEVARSMKEGNLDVTLFLTYLGDMYKNGLGVPQDIARAIEMYIDPAEEGNPRAQMALGEIFETDAAARDEARAAAYYAKAAENGVITAAIRVGDMCRDGRGVGGRKLEDAYMWYYLALLQGERLGQARIDELEGRGLLNFRSVNAATGRRARERANQIYETLRK